jgi:hypothetical protein
MDVPPIPSVLAADVLDSPSDDAAPGDTDGAVAVADCSGVCPLVNAAADCDPALPVPLLQPATAKVSARPTPVARDIRRRLFISEPSPCRHGRAVVSWSRLFCTHRSST